MLATKQCKQLRPNLANIKLVIEEEFSMGSYYDIYML